MLYGPRWNQLAEILVQCSTNTQSDKSTLCRDLVKDLREQGAICLDGKPVFDQGAYLT